MVRVRAWNGIITNPHHLSGVFRCDMCNTSYHFELYGRIITVSPPKKCNKNHNCENKLPNVPKMFLQTKAKLEYHREIIDKYK